MEKQPKISPIELLIKEIEEMLGFKIKTPKNFDFLRGVIFNRTGEFVSATTLKRIWGYIKEPINTRDSTFSLIARTVGYNDWNNFLERYERLGKDDEISSSPILTRKLKVSKDLKKGDILQLFWRPDRSCQLEYKGNLEFVVLDSQNTRLKSGDSFFCNIIIEGHPLYLSQLVQNGRDPVSYVCGLSHGGVHFEKK